MWFWLHPRTMNNDTRTVKDSRKMYLKLNIWKTETMYSFTIYDVTSINLVKNNKMIVYKTK